MTYVPVPIPSQLPAALTITLWDFSWYVRTGPGEPFEDLDQAFRQAKARGYNTIRICAMPHLLFRSGLDTSAITLEPLGGEYGQRLRWYDVKTPTTIDGRAKLLELFRLAKEHDVHIIVSSWEYQQSPAFSATSDWLDSLLAIDPEDRAVAQALAQADLVDFVRAHGLDDRIAYVEVHNEVQIGHLADGVEGSDGSDPDLVVALRPRLERALAAFHDRQPEVPVTVNYAGVPAGAMRGIPENVDVLVTHPYLYGVLGALVDRYGINGPAAGFDRESAVRDGLLPPDAPPISAWAPAHPWRSVATIIWPPIVYVHDLGDAAAFDRWLYDHWQEWRLEMLGRLRLWLDVARDWALAHRVPLVFGEGWVGYTPAQARFEEGPVGAEICRFAVDESIRVGAWGTIVCSNCAPQHAMWDDVPLQLQCNRAFLTRTPIKTNE